MKIVSDEANLHHLEADSMQLQVMRSKKNYMTKKHLLQDYILKGVEHKVPIIERRFQLMNRFTF